MARVIVAGSRDFDDYPRLCRTLDNILSYLDDVTIISGTARGADRLGERYAAERGYPTVRVPADWRTHGKAAGPRRNEEMADIAEYCVCFWDGKSRGTRNMIETAKRKGLHLRVITC